MGTLLTLFYQGDALPTGDLDAEAVGRTVFDYCLLYIEHRISGGLSSAAPVSGAEMGIGPHSSKVRSLMLELPGSGDTDPAGFVRLLRDHGIDLEQR